MAKHEFDGHLKKLPFGRTCVHCSGREKGLATECPGEPLTDEQCKGITAETLDYFNGKWWLAESEVDESQIYAEGGTTAATDLPRTIENALVLPCHGCKKETYIRKTEGLEHFSGKQRWMASCANQYCSNDHQVFGDDKMSVIHIWNKRQSNALNAPFKASVPEPTPTTPQGDKSDSRSLEARVTGLENTVASILKGRVFRRH